MPWGGDVLTETASTATESVGSGPTAHAILAQALLVAAQIDKIRKKLNEKLIDDSNRIWREAELLRWWNDGYRRFLSDSKAVKRFWIMDSPPRYTVSHAFPWEAREHSGMTWRFSAIILAGSMAGTTYWEAEHVEGLTPSASRRGMTQQWERAFGSGETDSHFRFMVPRDHEVVKRVAWDDERLQPVTVRELDGSEDGWMREAGEPVFWTGGVGPARSFEVFEIDTTYYQGYALESAKHGLPRRLTGDRTYSPVESSPRNNAYAYSSSGDIQALTGKGYGFDPTSSFTEESDRPHAFGLRPYRFTIDGRYFTPQIQRTFIHTWERDLGTATSRNIGTHVWERAHGYSQWDDPDPRPKIEGLGLLFTTEATDSRRFFYTQAWEKEQIEGSTVAATGALKGTYRWETQHGAAAYRFYLGTVRILESPNRDYMPVLMGIAKKRLTGRIVAWHSSANAISIWQIVIPEGELTENEEADLLPRQMLKYIRYYALSRAFGRAGEGRRGDLATHYEQRFFAGLAFFRKLGDVGFKDRTWNRHEIEPGRFRPARVRLPAEFPNVWAR